MLTSSDERPPHLEALRVDVLVLLLAKRRGVRVDRREAAVLLNQTGSLTAALEFAPTLLQRQRSPLERLRYWVSDWWTRRDSNR